MDPEKLDDRYGRAPAVCKTRANQRIGQNFDNCVHQDIDNKSLEDRNSLILIAFDNCYYFKSFILNKFIILNFTTGFEITLIAVR